jgi:hypothetical protein
MVKHSLNKRQKVIAVLTMVAVFYLFIQTIDLKMAIRDSLVVILFGGALAILCKDRA